MNRIPMMLACAAMFFAVQPALANDDVSSELAEMRELMKGLQQQVEAQEEQLDHQGQLLEQAQDVVRRDQGTESGMSPFLDMITVGGHVAGSYAYNLSSARESNEPGTDINRGDDNPFLPFHPDNNTMTIDQIWFSIAKEATEESRAGFAFDILFGQNANFLGQGVDEDNSRRYNNGDGTSDYYVAQAYVEYQCGCLGPEVNWKFGKFQTLTGGEIAQATGNFNITRGNVYSLVQPVDHLGLLATTNLGDMVELSAGIVNSGRSTVSSPDIDKEKSYLGSVMVGDDKMSLRTTFIYGSEGNTGSFSSPDHPNGRREGLVDVTGTFNPSDNISLWANYDYRYYEGTGLYINAVAVAGRVQVVEKLGVSLRGEYLAENVANEGGGPGALRGSESFINVNDDDDNKRIYSLTGTVDYALTDHLTARGEVRWDWIDDPGNHGFGFFENTHTDSLGHSDNQTIGLVEVVYAF